MTNLQKNLLQASFIGTFAEGMLTPVWAAMVQKVGGSVLDAGLGFCIFSMITGLTVLMAGRTRWFNKNASLVVLIGFIFAGIGDVLYILVYNKWQLFAVQSFIGLSVGLLGPAWDALYTEDGDNHTAKWSFWTGGISFVIGASALTGGLIITYFGYAYMFISMAIFDLFAIYYAYQIYRDDFHDDDEED